MWRLRYVALRYVAIQIPADVDDNHAGCGCQQHPGQADGQAGQQSSLFRPEHRLETQSGGFTVKHYNVYVFKNAKKFNETEHNSSMTVQI